MSLSGPAGDWGQAGDWDQDAALDALVAAVDAGRIEVPGEDEGWEDLGPVAAPEWTGSAAEAVPECADAGFLSREGGDGAGPVPVSRPGAAAGFASGCAADRGLPGPGLAGFADLAAGQDRRFPDVTDDELIGVLGGFGKVEAWAAAGKLSAAAELIRRRPPVGGERPGPGGMGPAWGKFCADELAVATASSGRAADQMLALAYDLAVRLPGTARALREGEIDAYKAQIIAETTRILDDAGAAAAEALLLRQLAGKTPGQVRAAAGRAVLAVDPGAARHRREQAQKDARVQFWREDAGTAALCGFGLPPAEALAADQLISARARDLRAAGLDGTMDQLRVRAYLDSLLGTDSAPQPGQDTQTAQPDGAGSPAASNSGAHASGPDGAGSAAASNSGAHASEPDGAGSAAADGTGPPGGSRNASGTAGETGGEADDSAGRSGGPGPAGTPIRPAGGGASIPAGLAARINLTIPLATLLGLADRPGEAAGFGPIDAQLARDLAAAAAASPATTWCVTVTDQQGHPAGHGCARPGQKRGRNGPERDSPERGGPERGGTPGSGSQARPPRRAGGIRAGDRARAGPAFTAGAGPGPPGGYGTWRLKTGPGDPELTVDIAPIPVSDCDHRDETPAYEPTGWLRHLVQIRDGECDWPPCRRAARRCDFEHTIPWQHGGRTCACNAGPRCRHHHHQKQDAGWRLDQHLPGYRTWTTPAGRQYTTGPTTYPI